MHCQLKSLYKRNTTKNLGFLHFFLWKILNFMKLIRTKNCPIIFLTASCMLSLLVCVLWLVPLSTKKTYDHIAKKKSLWSSGRPDTFSAWVRKANSTHSKSLIWWCFFSFTPTQNHSILQILIWPSHLKIVCEKKRSKTVRLRARSTEIPSSKKEGSYRKLLIKP